MLNTNEYISFKDMETLESGYNSMNVKHAKR